MHTQCRGNRRSPRPTEATRECCHGTDSLGRRYNHRPSTKAYYALQCSVLVLLEWPHLSRGSPLEAPHWPHPTVARPPKRTDALRVGGPGAALNRAASSGRRVPSVCTPGSRPGALHSDVFSQPGVPRRTRYYRQLLERPQITIASPPQRPAARRVPSTSFTWGIPGVGMLRTCCVGCSVGARAPPCPALGHFKGGEPRSTPPHPLSRCFTGG